MRTTGGCGAFRGQPRGIPRRRCEAHGGRADNARTRLCWSYDVDLPSLDDAPWTISAVDGAEFHLPLLRDAKEQYPDKARRLLLGGALVFAGLAVHALSQRVASVTCSPTRSVGC